MLIYGIVASPRKGKNTDLLVDQSLIGASKRGTKTEKIYIYDLNIKPCLACNQLPQDYCLIKDDMEKIYDILNMADAVILGIPNYYGSVPAPMKAIIDRCNCLVDIKSRKKKITKQKSGLLIVTADQSQRFGGIIRLINFWANDINLKIIGQVIATNTSNQSTKERPLLLKHVREKGRELANSLKK